MAGAAGTALRITGESVGDRTLAAWRSRLEALGAAGDAVLATGVSEDRLVHWIRSGHRLLIDANLDDSCLDCLPDLGGVLVDGICVCLTTSRAYEIDTYRLLVEAGITSPPPRDPDAMIDIGVREAMANAVIHGNLGISSELRDSFECWDRYSALLEERLSDPELARRPVALTAARGGGQLCVSVHDSGQGFDPARGQIRRGSMQHGRGVMLIRNSCADVKWDRGGRSVTMRYE